MIDFHTHILPDIDDGSSSVEESVRMIELLVEQGVRKVLLTPHFYAYMSSTESFAEKREAALEKLKKALNARKTEVDIYLGCEVLFFEELWRIENLDCFCIRGTKYILIEMPFASWERSAVECISNIISKGYRPIIVHFERYLKYSGNKEKILELTHMGAKLQMNCSSVISFFNRKRVLSYVKRKEIYTLMGTDCHNIDNRKPNYDKAIVILEKKLKNHQYKRFLLRQEDILHSAQKVYP